MANDIIWFQFCHRPCHLSRQSVGNAEMENKQSWCLQYTGKKKEMGLNGLSCIFQKENEAYKRKVKQIKFHI